MTGAHERIRAYLDEAEEKKGDLIDATFLGIRNVAGVRSVIYGPELTMTDLRDEVAELDAHIELLIDIDKVLDEEGLTLSAEDAIDAIRDLMGNHSEERK